MATVYFVRLSVLYTMQQITKSQINNKSNFKVKQPTVIRDLHRLLIQSCYINCSENCVCAV